MPGLNDLYGFLGGVELLIIVLKTKNDNQTSPPIKPVFEMELEKLDFQISMILYLKEYI